MADDWSWNKRKNQEKMLLEHGPEFECKFRLEHATAAAEAREELR